MRFSREIGLVFLWSCVFFKACGLHVFGLVVNEFCLFFGLVFGRFLFCGLLFFKILWHFCSFNLLLKAYWACFYENFLIWGLFFRIGLPAFLFNFLADFFVLLNFHANGCWACFSVKLPVCGLCFKFTCLFLQNNLASLKISLFK